MHTPSSLRLFYNAGVKTWDVIVIGGGIIGLSLAIALRKRGAAVLVVERGEPGREASYAAGGMLVDCSLETPASVQPLATASARMYPEFAYELEVESDMKVDLRAEGTILFPSLKHAERDAVFMANHPLPCQLQELEPKLAGPSVSGCVSEGTQRRSASALCCRVEIRQAPQR